MKAILAILMLKTPVLIAALLISTILTAACNTTSGLGQDIEAAGDAIEDEAEENKKY